MATGRKTVTVGQVIDPNTWGNLVWDQSVQEFASDADRTAQFPVAQRRPGVVTWLDDWKVLQVWDGAAWQNFEAPVQGYVPVWTAGGAAVNPGTGGVNQGKYRQTGRVIEFWIKSYVAGTGFNGGAAAAQWAWTLPAGNADDYYPVTGYLFRPGEISPPSPQVVGAWIQAGTSLVQNAVMGTGNQLVGGLTMPSGSMLLLHGRYAVP